MNENEIEDARWLGQLVGKKWSDCVYADFARVKEVFDNHSAAYLVWPEEGAFLGDKWQFNGAHKGFEPLLLDAMTANALVTVHNAITDKAKFLRMIAASRGQFAKIVNFCWKHVK